MTSFIWDRHFLTGISEVDEQHHGLVDLINAFGDHVAAGDASSAELTKIVGQLREYARYHFREEEALMEAGGIDPRALEARQLRAISAGVLPAAAYDDEQNVDAGPVQPLVDAISGLLRVVEEKNRELQDSNAMLEKRVDERTRELQHLNEAMHQLAMHDALTGLPNRRQATDFLDAQWAGRALNPISCIMIDADHFKQINDSFGHDEGDKVLKGLATEIHQGFRTDDLACRLGGDEFLVICPNTSLSIGLDLAEGLLRRIGALTLQVRGGAWHGSLSIGVAAATPEMEAPVDLLRAADEGLYAAKAAGRNTVRTIQASNA